VRFQPQCARLPATEDWVGVTCKACLRVTEATLERMRAVVAEALGVAPHDHGGRAIDDENIREEWREKVRRYLEAKQTLGEGKALEILIGTSAERAYAAEQRRSMAMPTLRPEFRQQRRHEPRYRDVHLATLISNQGQRWPVTETNISDEELAFMLPCLLIHSSHTACRSSSAPKS
jgi:hypothetical protein